MNSALQHLGEVKRDYSATANRITTGLKVATAADNGSTWALAQGMRHENAGRSEALNSIDLATGVVETALAAAEGVSDLMVEMQEKLVAATDTALDEQSWRSLMSDFIALGNQTQRLVENASFNGLNLLEAGASDLSALIAGRPDQTLSIAAEDLSDGGGIFDSALGSPLPLSGTSSLTDQPDQAMIDTFSASLDAVNEAVGRLGTGLRALDIQRTLLVNQIDVAERGIGNLIDADLGRESARLQALSAREQLAQQAASIANQAPRVILSFFQ